MQVWKFELAIEKYCIFIQDELCLKLSWAMAPKSHSLIVSFFLNCYRVYRKQKSQISFLFWFSADCTRQRKKALCSKFRIRNFFLIIKPLIFLYKKSANFFLIEWNFSKQNTRKFSLCIRIPTVFFIPSSLILMFLWRMRSRWKPTVTK